MVYSRPAPGITPAHRAWGASGLHLGSHDRDQVALTQLRVLRAHCLELLRRNDDDGVSDIPPGAVRLVTCACCASVCARRRRACAHADVAGAG
eukprot:2268118-Rhodomonas_salina.1